ncbi:MAG: sulfatase [Akkermansiaceae bacterium]
MTCFSKWIVLSFVSAGACLAAEKKPNILFIAIDDLRPELGAYGAKHIHSPNIDRFAKSGLLFSKAYTSVATCGASRASLFSGVRPTPERFLTHYSSAEKEVPWAVTMNTRFKKSGYRTLSLGKIFHLTTDNAAGWSEKPWRPKAPKHALPANRSGERGNSTEISEVADDAYQDGEIANEAVSRLGELANEPDQPFFLAVGFMKPHLPFAAPKKYWDLYPEETIGLPDNYRLPEKAPAAATRFNWGELRNYSDIPRKGKITETKATHLIRGYYACVSYVDTQIGKVLDELDRLGLAENTIVVLWGDHGWNLGDHTFWCKHTVFESSLHIPLIVRVPGLPQGKKTNVLTESVDIYPTLCELAAVPAPDTLEGRSFADILKKPETTRSDTAYSRFGRGDSIRSPRFRYSEYRGKDGKLTGRMLYDHQNDPLENENLIDIEKYSDQIKTLSNQLKKVKASTRKN